MPEHHDRIVRLRGRRSGVASASLQAVREEASDAPAEGVSIRLSAYAPDGQVQVKLWDHAGRNPEMVANWPIAGRVEYRQALNENAQALDLRTMTWSGRFRATRPDRFELHLQVLQVGEAEALAEFVYAGPLQEADIEEISGRFHFKVFAEG